MAKKKPKVPEILTSDSNAEPQMIELLARNIALGMKPYDAAIDAGYTESSANGGIYKTMKGERFQSLLRSYILQHNLVQLPKYLQLDDMAVDAALRKAETSDDAAIAVAGKVNQTAKRKFAMAGLLKERETDANPTIRIDSVQNLMLKIGEKTDKS